jgi:hypothetical protein
MWGADGHSSCGPVRGTGDPKRPAAGAKREPVAGLLLTLDAMRPAWGPTKAQSRSVGPRAVASLCGRKSDRATPFALTSAFVAEHSSASGAAGPLLGRRSNRQLRSAPRARAVVGPPRSRTPAFTPTQRCRAPVRGRRCCARASTVIRPGARSRASRSVGCCTRIDVIDVVKRLIERQRRARSGQDPDELLFTVAPFLRALSERSSTEGATAAIAL